ncbi:MAG: hypothetical protein ABR987_24305 [Terracidiphilus sp.]|jgi:hypothetical protein
MMKRTALLLTAALLVAPAVLAAQSSSFSSSLASSSLSSSSFVAPEADPGDGAGQVTPSAPKAAGPNSSFTRIGVGVGISTLGVRLQAATNLGNHIALRGSGNFFNYSANFTSNGIAATAKLSLSTAGVAVDFFPFKFPFRLSPGLLFYNGNQLTATTDVAAGTSFTLNGTKYYSANTNAATGAVPVTGTGTLGLNTTKPAFTITTGIGNMVPSKGHWSFPFEIGVAFIGAPSVKVNLGGWACYDQAQTQCADLSNANNPITVAIQSNLMAQETKWNSDLNPLKTYPIVSGGVSYSFHLR